MRFKFEKLNIWKKAMDCSRAEVVTYLYKEKKTKIFRGGIYCFL